MRKLLTYLAVVLITFNISAQDYNYFNCTWHELGESIGPEFANLRLRISPEPTIINGMDYHRVEVSNMPDGDTFFDTSDLVRFSGNKIYEINDFSTDEFLLYDFDVNIGDEISTRTCQFNVIDVDSILLLDGTYRKRLYVSNNQGDVPFSWIEGIGDLKGFLNPRYCSMSDNIAIVCHYNEDTQIYQNPNFDDCWILSSTKEVDTVSSLMIYPNPSTGMVRVEYPSSLIRTVEVFTTFGQQIYTTTLNTYQADVDLSIYDRGTYIIRLQTNDKNIHYQKVVLIK